MRNIPVLTLLFLYSCAVLTAQENPFVKIASEPYIVYAADFPEKLFYYSEMAKLYSSFKEYEATKRFYEKILADSSAVMRARTEDDFDLRRLHRVEQHARQERIDAELIRNKSYRQSLTAVSVFVALFIALSALLYRLYRQKQLAYRALVIKTQQWAQTPFVQENPAKENTPNNPTAMLDYSAGQMEVNRIYLSQAVNRCIGDNFTAFINEFRIKEAVHLMSQTQSNAYTIEGIATDAGFKDRITFYRAFKKMIGCTPATFRNNVQV